MAHYVLPELDYDYAAIEPAISGEIMELHHSQHHAAYVKGAGEPEGELAAAIDEHCGSFDTLREHMTAVSTTIQGSGSGVLAWEPIGQQLIVQQLWDHQSNLSVSTDAPLMFDMWEHAFYLQYRNAKADYVKALWTVVNWSDVAARFDAARAASAVTV